MPEADFVSSRPQPDSNPRHDKAPIRSLALAVIVPWLSRLDRAFSQRNLTNISCPMTFSDRCKSDHRARTTSRRSFVVRVQSPFWTALLFTLLVSLSANGALSADLCKSLWIQARLTRSWPFSRFVVITNRSRKHNGRSCSAASPISA